MLRVHLGGHCLVSCSVLVLPQAGLYTGDQTNRMKTASAGDRVRTMTTFDRALADRCGRRKTALHLAAGAGDARRVALFQMPGEKIYRCQCHADVKHAPDPTSLRRTRTGKCSKR